MTLTEFKAWFEGFSEIMEGAPNEKQWDRIKARVAEINGTSTPYPVYIDRYVEPYRRYWPNTPYWSSNSCSPALKATSHVGTGDMFDLGKAEYKSISA